MKNIRGIALFGSIVSLAIMAAIYFVTSLIGTMPSLSNGNYMVVFESGKIISTRNIPSLGKQFWLLAVPIITFSVCYFVKILQTDYEKITRVIGWYLKFGVLVGIIVTAFGMSFYSFNTISILSVIIAQILFCTASSIFTNDLIEAAIVSTTSNIVTMIYYTAFVTPYKIEFVILLPGIAITFLLLNIISMSLLPFIVSILERVFAKEFWKSIYVGLKQSVQ